MIIQIWNTSLATKAENWAAKCLWEHDKDARSERFGQNLQTASGSNSENVTAADEKNDYDYETQSCAGGKMCGHYTQVCAELWPIPQCNRFKQ